LEIAQNTFGLCNNLVVEEESSTCMILQILKDNILNNISTPEEANTPKRTTKLDPIERADKLRGYIQPEVEEPKILEKP